MAAKQRLGVGIIGAGNISTQYLRAMKDFPVLDIRGISDMRPDVAKKQADAYGVKAMSVADLLASPAVHENTRRYFTSSGNSFSFMSPA